MRCPALPVTARSGWFPPSAQQPGEGRGLPGLWLDKGYSLQELKISLLKKREWWRGTPSILPWAQADSSHSRVSRTVWAGKVYRG